MSSHDNGGNDEKQKAALQDKCKLKVYKMQDSSGRVHEAPHPRQEEVDELAKTDLNAAAELADQVRLEAAERTKKFDANEAQRKAAQEAADTRKKKEVLEQRQQVEHFLQELGEARTESNFFAAAAGLAEHADRLTSSDLKIYTAIRDEIIGTKARHWTREEVQISEVLQEKINNELKKVSAFYAESKDPNAAENRLLADIKRREAAAPQSSPKQPKPKSFFDTVRSWFK